MSGDGDCNNLVLSFQGATGVLAGFLGKHLSGFGTDWWSRHVYSKLTYSQQRIVHERSLASLTQLDFAALLRVLDQNWYELSTALNLPREGRTWVKELQSVRNKWAHQSADAMQPSEVFRDTDTLARLLTVIDADGPALAAVESLKARALTAMTPEPPVKTNDSEASPTAPNAHPYNPGELVALRSAPDVRIPILKVIPGGSETRYEVLQNNAVVTLYESQIQPLQKQSDGQPHLLTAQQLRAHLTAMHLSSPSTANLYSLRSGRVQFVPYQYRPVLKLIRADRPRLLIADEVGVGKTIEAGLIIKELRARMDLSSVLVICPKALVAERKWFLEMKRFDEHFTALDGKLLRHCLHETHLDGGWPSQYSKALLPFSLFDSDLIYGKEVRGRKSTQGLLALDPPPKFDLVIVDEAHHLRNPQTLLHQGVRYFCDNAQAVLLLTATPVQLGSEDLFTLLNVLRPDLIIDSASFSNMAAPNRFINEAVRHCRIAQPKWQSEARVCLESVADTEWGSLFLREAPEFQQICDQLQEESLNDTARIALTRAIEGLYTFSAMISRTRRRDIGEFTTRKAETLTVAFTADQLRLHNGLLEVVAQILEHCHGQTNVKFMMTTIRRQAASCLYGLAPMLRDMLAGKVDQLEILESADFDGEMAQVTFGDKIRADIRALLDHAENLDPRDPKIEAFIKVLEDKSSMENNKALVFSTFRHSLAYLAKHTAQAGLRYGLIHGGIPDEERAELRQRFKLPKESPEAIDVLLSSEVGCEGLDFQFCDLLVNYDLPWNPMKIEQRIGRIDRYGQESETVAIVNLVTPGTVDADIYDRCLMRIGVFQQAIGGNEEILGEITEEIHHIAESFTLSPEEREARLRQLADNGIRQIREEQELESKQAELFGLNLPTQTWNDELKAAESSWLAPAALENAVSTYLESRLQSDSDHILGARPLKTLRLSQEARSVLLEDYRRLPRSNDPEPRAWEKWLKGMEPTCAITFDQETAAETAGATHLTVLHPLVRQAAKHLELKESARVTLSASSSVVPPGQYPFALYRWQYRGLKPDESLVPIAADPALESALLALLVSATQSTAGAPANEADLEALDARHYKKWSEARGNYITENRQWAEHRAQSLTVSHRARCKAIQDQIDRATNDKIRIMKESELARAHADYEQRMEELKRAAERADVLSDSFVTGLLTIE